jgi:hypothetical protein
MLLKCGTAVNAVPTLLRACPPVPPKNICDELGINPNLDLDFIWSGTFACCAGCFAYDPFYHMVEVIECPTGLGSTSSVPAGVFFGAQTVALTGQLVLRVRVDEYGNLSTDCNSPFYVDYTFTEAKIAWGLDLNNTLHLVVFVEYFNAGLNPAILFHGVVSCLEATVPVYFVTSGESCGYDVTISSTFFHGNIIGGGGTYTATIHTP